MVFEDNYIPIEKKPFIKLRKLENLDIQLKTNNRCPENKNELIYQNLQKII